MEPDESHWSYLLEDFLMVLNTTVERLQYFALRVCVEIVGQT